MANLVPNPGLDEVYQLETGDLVLAGPGGIANLQAQQLLNRLAYLQARQGFQRIEEKTGSTVGCVLNEDPGDSAVVMCYVNRIPAFPGKNFTRAGTAITFTPAVSADDEIIFVY